MNPIDEWLVELNEEEVVASFADVLACVQRAESLSEGRLWVGKNAGLSPWWYRWLGMNRRYVEPIFSLEWYSGTAALIFHDENWSEYRALRSEKGFFIPENIRSKISHGEATPPESEECIAKEKAFEAIREVLCKGVRPEWLSYRFVE